MTAVNDADAGIDGETGTVGVRPTTCCAVTVTVFAMDGATGMVGVRVAAP